MGNGKICISIFSETSGDLLEKLAGAEHGADVVELRLDHMNSIEIKKVFAALKPTKPVLFTYRPESQGGKAADAVSERFGFWMSLFSACEIEKDLMWLDNEIDLGTALKWPEGYTTIRSFHDHDSVPHNLDAIYDSLESMGQIVKIAVQVENATDALPLWKLLDKAKADNRSVIPIAMGEAGKWTRILGLAHGAFMTYAAAEAGAETAPGQISAEDMIEVFRVKELDRETEVFAIIAGDTSYTASPWMHNAAFKAAGMNCVFVPLQVTDLDEFITRMVDPETREVELNFKGFSVTNPHKKAIISYLDGLDQTAKKIGAVNTVNIEDGKLFGYNTDAHGFITPLIKSFGPLKGVRVGIVGAGGAARACIYGLKQENAKVTVFARSPKSAAALAEEFGVKAGSVNNSFKPGEIDILVNATPLGTKGENQELAILNAHQMQGLKFVYDLVYNPLQTRLIREARIAGVPAMGGLDMVLAQGRKQFEIWTGEPAPTGPMRSALLKRVT